MDETRHARLGRRRMNTNVGACPEEIYTHIYIYRPCWTYADIPDVYIYTGPIGCPCCERENATDRSGNYENSTDPVTRVGEYTPAGIVGRTTAKTRENYFGRRRAEFGVARGTSRITGSKKTFGRWKFHVARVAYSYMYRPPGNRSYANPTGRRNERTNVIPERTRRPHERRSTRKDGKD